jgi:membrane protease YdiL (CAAX protease family)
MRDWILRLSPRGELLLVSTVGLAALLAGSATAELLLLFFAGWMLRARGWTSERLGLRFSGRAILAGLALAIASLLLYWFTALTVASFVPAYRPLEAISRQWAGPVALIVIGVVVNAVYEELLVTGYVVSALAKKGAAYAIIASTLLRVLGHLGQGPLAALSVVPIGLLFGTVYWRTRSLWPLLVASALLNVVSVLVWAHLRA